MRTIKGTITKDVLASITPDEAVEILKKGNERFINNLKMHRDLLEQVNQTSDNQFPFAFILSCMDSRTSSELVFDQGLGDLLNCRIAGNVLNKDILGSMEFAVEVIGVKAIVIMGHTKCGAIKGACDDVKVGHLTKLLERIKPAIEEEKTVTENRTSSNEEFVEKVTRLHVFDVIRQVYKFSPIVSEAVKTGKVKLVGGMYDVETGKVDFYE
ncbi:MAG: carbonic anhydrase family protein [Bacteroidota bacterium]